MAKISELDNKKYNFSNDKLTEIASEIKLVYIDNTNSKLISIGTYQQIVEKSVDLA